MTTQRVLPTARPVARLEKVVVTETADEVLLYDTEKHHIRHLNATTAAVWRHCDGMRTVDELAGLAGQELDAPVGEATVRLALTRLEDAGLLQEPLAAELRVSRMTRRAFMRRAGVAGAIAVPAIVSTTAPAYATGGGHSSSCGGGCQNDDQCRKRSEYSSHHGGDCPYCVQGICEENDCGKPCSSDRHCDSRTCPDCVNRDSSGSGVCGKKVEVCGDDCQSDEYCQGGTDGCTQCRKKTKQWIWDTKTWEWSGSRKCRTYDEDWPSSNSLTMESEGEPALRQQSLTVEDTGRPAETAAATETATATETETVTVTETTTATDTATATETATTDTSAGEQSQSLVSGTETPVPTETATTAATETATSSPED